MVTIYLGLGANLGNRLENLRTGLRRLPPRVQVTGVAPLYESDPVGPRDQPNYYNSACCGLSNLAPLDLLDFLKSIEFALGRRPGHVWGPRPLDLDILLYGTEQIDEPRLQVPHPRLRERAFVLAPLAELAPDLAMPPDGCSPRLLLQAVGDAGVRRIAAPGWELDDHQI